MKTAGESGSPVPQPAASEQQKPKEQPQVEQKQNVDALRTVIKVDQKNPPEKESKPFEQKKEQKPPTPEVKDKTPPTIPTIPKIPQAQATAAPAAGSREDLEQRRNILQSIKDFDFQIKKNQEDIGKLTEKIDSLTKDLDDLVSLYEIVSEQMNPFVGLSKVTKKRLDALENFTKEIDTLNTRIGEIESVLEKNKMLLTGKISASSKSTLQNKSELQQPESKTSTAEKETVAPQGDAVEKNNPPEVPKPSIVQPGGSPAVDVWSSFTDEDIDKILAESLTSLMVDQNIDSLINDFLLNLK